MKKTIRVAQLQTRVLENKLETIDALEPQMQRAVQQRIRAERFRRVRGTIGSHFAFRREKMRKRGSLRFIERTIEPDSIQPDIHTFRPPLRSISCGNYRGNGRFCQTFSLRKIFLKFFCQKRGNQPFSTYTVYRHRGSVCR